MVRVSIHAPAWGATPNRGKLGCRLQVSIHAPAWGATLRPSLLQKEPVLFQSTHPRGVRPSTARRISYLDCRFNPRTRVGCDPVFPGRFYNLTGFNPRTRVGCDAQIMQHDFWQRVSIHAPAWGATKHFQIRYARSRRAFQSTHPRGVRQTGGSTGQSEKLFQSTHPRGVRP